MKQTLEASTRHQVAVREQPAEFSILMFASEDGTRVLLRNHSVWIGASEQPQCIYSASSGLEDDQDAEPSHDHTGAVLWPCSYVMALILERSMSSIVGPAIELGAGTY